MSNVVSHPAKFSDKILGVLSEIVDPNMLVLDPFAGVGRLKEILPFAVLNELEFEWAVQGKPAKAIQGDALTLPFASGTFDCICVSPVYGNRMSDSFEAKDGSRRHTYRHTLGRPLHHNNSGKMQWGDEYRAFHVSAWRECTRVLRPLGLFVLNVSDHIRGGKVMPVSEWHFNVLSGFGYVLIETKEIHTPRQRHGANGCLRVDHENVFVFRKPS